MKGKTKGKRTPNRGKGKFEKNNYKDQDRLTDTGGTSKDSPEEGSHKQLTSLNDIGWYNRYPELLAAAASIPYPYRPGMYFNSGSVAEAGAAVSVRDLKVVKTTLPGVLALNWMPCIPKSQSATDAVAIAAREIYARVRKVYSGRLYADAPDFIMFLLALDSIYAYIAWLHRIYRTICAYTPDNMYSPDVLLTSYGLSEAGIMNVKQNQMQLFQNITELVHMVSKFNCPAEFDLMNRHYWMSRNVYADGPGINTQLYVFNLLAVWDFGMVNTPDDVPAGGLKCVPISQAGQTVDSLFAFGKKLIDDLAAWEDSYTISGYLARAFEGSPMFMPDFPVVNEVLTFEYQPEVLSQIENSYTNTGYPGYEMANSPFTISQDPKTNAIIFNPKLTLDPAHANEDLVQVSGYRTDLLTHMINIHSSANPTVQDTVIASRLRTVLDTRSISKVVPMPASVTELSITCGTEWLFNYTLFAQVVNGVPLSQGYTFTNVAMYDFSSNYGTAKNIKVAIDGVLRQFDWAPVREMLVYDASAGTFTGVIYSWDIFTSTLLSDDDLENIHRVCSYSELNAFSI